MDDIIIKDVVFSYDNLTVLDHINMNIESGDFVCLLGESGCGKSTLLRLLAGLTTPDSGSINVRGNEIKGAGLDRGVVFQDYSLFPWFTTGENILIAMKQKFKNVSNNELKQRILGYLNQVGLNKSVYDMYPSELSGGMRQRSAICRAFALDPPILLMDEPFGALDEVTRNNLQNLVLKLWRQDEKNRKTIVFVTHDVEEAILLSTKIFVFASNPGRIVYNYAFDKNKTIDREQLLNSSEIINLKEQLKNLMNKNSSEICSKKI